MTHNASLNTADEPTRKKKNTGEVNDLEVEKTDLYDSSSNYPKDISYSVSWFQFALSVQTNLFIFIWKAHLIQR